MKRAFCCCRQDTTVAPGEASVGETGARGEAVVVEAVSCRETARLLLIGPRGSLPRGARSGPRERRCRVACDLILGCKTQYWARRRTQRRSLRVGDRACQHRVLGLGMVASGARGAAGAAEGAVEGAASKLPLAPSFPFLDLSWPALILTQTNLPT